MFARAIALGALLTIQSSQVPFKSQTELVVLNVTVTDEHDRRVTGLTQDDFTVTEDGRPQPIAQFAQGSVPLSLLVALDASGSMAGARFEFACRSVLELMDRFGPEDEIGVFGFNDYAFNIQTWTRDREAVAQALRRVKPDGYTALYGAVSAGLDGLASAHHRRRAILVISDGDDRLMSDVATSGDFTPAQRRAMPVIDRVGRSEALVYAIGIDAPSPYRLDSVALRKLTDPTGGFTEIVRSDAAVAGAVARIGDELRLQYVLGFAPAHPGDGKFHRVHVTVRGCGKCRARARVGYFADPT